MNSRRLNLRDLAVLTIDCQATGSGPRSGDLLEIGWLDYKACLPPDESSLEENARSFLVRLPGNKKIPRQVRVITGIQNEDMRRGGRSGIIWRDLHQAARITAEANRMDGCPAVVHFARYEKPFLLELAGRFDREEQFPFRLICTHEIMSRLMPGLPRKSLRAVAGYFGHSMPKLRRSLSHVVATAHIWFHLVSILESEQGIRTYGELLGWLGESSQNITSPKRAREYPIEKKYRHDLPDSPGIYLMYRSNMDLLYVGKAKSIKRRVATYFRKKGGHSEPVLEMLSQARILSYSLTPTAVQAALLESDLIKDLSPSYNVALRETPISPVFFTLDLSDCSTRPGRAYPVGPLPSDRFGRSLFRLMQAGARKTIKSTVRERSEILSTPPEYVPSAQVFRQGILELMNEYNLPAPSTWTLALIRQFGWKLWMEFLEERKARKESGNPEISPESRSGSDTEKTLSRRISPGQVKRSLKFVVRNGTFQMRRARWLSRLSESSLEWDSVGGSGSGKNIIVFSKGRIEYATRHSTGKTCVRTEKERVPHEERLKNFDNYVYDRMRVLSSEIKRLLAEEREVRLWLRPDIPLTSERLRKMMNWV